jgi:hypothetical protein
MVAREVRRLDDAGPLDQFDELLRGTFERTHSTFIWRWLDYYDTLDAREVGSMIEL